MIRPVCFEVGTEEDVRRAFYESPRKRLVRIQRQMKAVLAEYQKFKAERRKKLSDGKE